MKEGESNYENKVLRQFRKSMPNQYTLMLSKWFVTLVNKCKQI